MVPNVSPSSLDLTNEACLGRGGKGAAQAKAAAVSVINPGWQGIRNPGDSSRPPGQDQSTLFLHSGFKTEAPAKVQSTCNIQ